VIVFLEPVSAYGCIAYGCATHKNAVETSETPTARATGVFWFPAEAEGPARPTECRGAEAKFRVNAEASAFFLKLLLTFFFCFFCFACVSLWVFSDPLPTTHGCSSKLENAYSVREFSASSTSNLLRKNSRTL
jgi:hypothetical protein